MNDNAGARIARARRRRGLSQSVLAGLVGRSESWLSQVEGFRAKADEHQPGPLPSSLIRSGGEVEEVLQAELGRWHAAITATPTLIHAWRMNQW